jgi:tetratricopeptide (TPR) repeat protein
MKCSNCGAEIKLEYRICPYCGKNIQIVPDYNFYDEDDIKIIVQNANDTEKKAEYIRVQREEKALAKQRAEEAAKQRKMKITLAMVAIGCMLLIILGVLIKVSIDNNNSNSFAYQMKQADSAMFKGNIDEAEQYYLKALILDSDNIEVRLELADLYLKKKDTKQAERYLKETITRDRENYDAYRMLYDIYEEAGNTEAILKLKDGVTNVKIQSIFISYNVDAPLLTHTGGTYHEDFKVSISAKKGLDIYYTLNGGDPKTAGTKYKNSIEIEGAGMHTIKVVAQNELGVFSDVITETYVIEYDAPADPVVTPNGGIFDKETYVYVAIPAGCTVYYTWDRTNPTEESEKYVSPILIPEGRNMLSVIIINDETGLTSGIYRGMFEYTKESAETESAEVVEEE